MVQQFIAFRLVRGSEIKIHGRVTLMSMRTNSSTLVAIADSGKVQLGGFAPALQTVDIGKVRLGGFAPTLVTVDTGKVRLGGFAPALKTMDAGRVRMGGFAPVLESGADRKVRVNGAVSTALVDQPVVGRV